jgi:hypothetical protein
VFVDFAVEALRFVNESSKRLCLVPEYPVGFRRVVSIRQWRSPPASITSAA